MTNAFARGVPGIVISRLRPREVLPGNISRPGIWSYGPERRESTEKPKEYPNSNLPVLYNATPVKQEPPPWVVSKQWPEGERAVVQDQLSSTDEGVEESGDVIVLEWSSDGVHYGEKLIENENKE